MTSVVSDHLCECGCGERTRLARQTVTATGWVRGQPIRFVLGHHRRRTDGKPGRSPFIHPSGYRFVYRPEHPKASGGFVREHVVTVEDVLGHLLPSQAEIHHVNENKADNRHCNLVACQDHAYHSLLHVRTRALDGCGNPNWRRCQFCGTYDQPSNMVPDRKGPQSGLYHLVCRRPVQNARRATRLTQARGST